MAHRISVGHRSLRKVSCIYDADTATCIPLGMADKDHYSSVRNVGDRSSYCRVLSRVDRTLHSRPHRYGHRTVFVCMETYTANGDGPPDIDCSNLLIIFGRKYYNFYQ